MTGMMFGIGLTVTLGQLPALLGVEPPSGGFFPKLWHLVTHLGDADGTTVLVGLASIAALVACKRLIPAVPASRSCWWPASSSRRSCTWTTTAST